MKTILLSLLLCLACSWGAAAQTVVPLGVWADDTGESHIEIYRCGELLCGKLVWLQQPQEAITGKPKLDQHNPDPDKRTVPLHNMPVLQGLRYNPGSDRWEDGQIYDPSNGHTYSCYLSMAGKDKLEVKGYIGFSLIGRSHYWVRVR
ncbi:DUF2147 domain-containing protein [Hymenobacter chitinivorans]|uniref:Uncharacterized protein DUF2147 n=1 Tax=Hymenobacter chitinivorans DSM 11115 TaxID=1121954 RepID=A0A2M9BQL9_9BACT|nr:DUF2147 domain-containing protein [Hymenobacter chitinivorans]PJJ60260.1 uncharacterized protein DUF2147 [Hymenobacter chitinivorans DSM 11115]